MRHPLSDDAGTQIVRASIDGSTMRALDDSRAYVRDGVPVGAVVIDSMTFHPDDFHEAKIALGDEIEAQLFRSTFSAVRALSASAFVPRDHVVLQDATGSFRQLVRFR
jgi:hypothetical protein